MTVGCYGVGGWASKVPRENDLAAKPVREPLQIECESTSRARRDGESERRRDAGKTSRATYISIPLVPAKAGTQTPDDRVDSRLHGDERIVDRSECPMRHIDAFCHFFPPRLFEKMSRTAGGTKDIGKRIQGVRTIYDLDARLKMMDEFDDYAEILSLGLPPLEAM